MEIYYFVLVMVVLALGAALARSRRADTIVLLLVVFSTIAVSGLRWASDVDHPDYAEMYAETPELRKFTPESIWDLHGEPGYLLASSIFRTLGFDFYVFSFLCVVFAMTAKAFVALRLAQASSLVLALYLCIHFVTIEFIQIRWALAAGLIALGFLQLHAGRLRTAVALVVVATFFHYFSALFLAVMAMVRLKSRGLFYTLVAAMIVVGAGLALEGLVPTTEVDSDIYVVKRTLRYLTDPLSSVGPLSYLKLLMFPVVYLGAKWLFPLSVGSPDVQFLKRVTFASLAATVLMSFVPLMHFRAVVLADFFGLLMVARILEDRIESGTRGLTMAAFATLFAVWFVFDVANYVAADRLYEYRTWLPFLT